MSDKQHDFGSLVCIYSQLLPMIREAAKPLGYAIAIHGTMTRDFDLLAVPWIQDAAEPLVLVHMVAEAVGGYVIGDVAHKGTIPDHPTEQPHGRVSWNICWGGNALIDLSVMPPSNPARGAESKSCPTCDRLIEALKLATDFMRHRKSCPAGSFYPNSDVARGCTCGYEKALSTIEEIRKQDFTRNQ